MYREIKNKPKHTQSLPIPIITVVCVCVYNCLWYYNNMYYSLVFIVCIAFPICSTRTRDRCLLKAARKTRGQTERRVQTRVNHISGIWFSVYGNVIFITIIYHVHVIPALCVYYRAGRRSYVKNIHGELHIILIYKYWTHIPVR